MGDPSLRKSLALGRLRNELKKKQESLADHFSFRMYITFHFKGKNSAVFEVADVVPVMTNNYEETIKEGAKNDAYSVESSKELLDKDIVQFHAPRWQPLRQDIAGCMTDVDYFLWPRNDIEKMECSLFSKWKDDPGPYKKLESEFQFCHSTIGKNVDYLMSSKDDTGLIVTNLEQNVFVFLDRLHLQTQSKSVTILKLCSVCVYLPQDQLMCWSRDTMEQTLRQLQFSQHPTEMPTSQ